MELFIAGGCGEHGRNCFYVEQNGEAFLVDCGLLAGAEDNLPRLNAEQIQKLRAVFLTHSHADHTGALPWLAQQGYQGSIYATLPTLTQLPFSLNHIRALESLCPCKTFGTVPELSGLQVTTRGQSIAETHQDAADRQHSDGKHQSFAQFLEILHHKTHSSLKNVVVMDASGCRLSIIA